MTIIRAPILRGVRDVQALLFAGPRATDDAIQRWEEGISLMQMGGGEVLLRFARPKPLRCDVGRAMPLIEDGGRLVALPLTPEQLDEAPPGAVVHLEHGRLVVREPVTTVDPVQLLDLSGWHLESPIVVTEARPAPPRAHPSAAPEPRLVLEPIEFDSRTSLGAREAPTRRDERAQRRLRRRSTSSDGRANTPGRHSPTRAFTPRILDRFAQRRDQRYLDELTRLFASGDVERALRRAIPLNGDGERGARFAHRWGTREHLRISPNRPRPAAVVDVEAGLQKELEQRYRSAVSQLEREGRILDAAFVLADLLNRTGEACSFLERHGEIRLAAELAEARSTNHTEVVRLWWRAGNRVRAVAVARTRDCFGPAILRLEREGNQAEANGLRQAWMSQLLEAGDLIGAYDAGSGIDTPAARALRSRLIDLGVEEGGSLQARMLARQLRAGDAEPHPKLMRLADDPTAARRLEILTTDLTATGTPVDHPDVVRELVRRLLSGRYDIERKTLQSAIDLARDPAFRNDIPDLTAFAERGRPPMLEAVWVEVDATDAGQLPVSDARLLPDGRLVVAVDGAGIRVVRPSGRMQAEFDIAADYLIPSDNGLRLLALRAVEDSVFAVTVIAIPDRKVRRIGEIRATAWAHTFDGANWFLADHGQLWMLDMLADGPVALWRETQHQEPIVAISRAPGFLAVASTAYLYDEPEGRMTVVVRRYGLPGLAESSTGRDVLLPGSTLLPSGKVASGHVADFVHGARVEPGESGTLAVVAHKHDVEAPVAIVRLGGATRCTIRIDHGALVVADDRGRVEVVGLDSGTRQSFRATI